jgi:hypothetical protein
VWPQVLGNLRSTRLSEILSRSNPVTKKLGFKALTLATCLGLSVVLVSGCNPEEPAKTAAPPPGPTVKTPPGKPGETKAPTPAPKEAGKPE